MQSKFSWKTKFTPSTREQPALGKNLLRTLKPRGFTFSTTYVTEQIPGGRRISYKVVNCEQSRELRLAVAKGVFAYLLRSRLCRIDFGSQGDKILGKTVELESELGLVNLL